MTLRLSLVAAFGLWLAAPAWSESFFFSTGNPDGKLGALTVTSHIVSPRPFHAIPRPIPQIPSLPSA